MWKQTTGTAFRNNTAISFGLKGSADISGIVKGGIRLEVECKSGMARQSPTQIVFKEMIEKYGGIYLIARITHKDFLEQAVEQTLDQLQKILQLRGIEIPR